MKRTSAAAIAILVLAAVARADYQPHGRVHADGVDPVPTVSVPDQKNGLMRWEDKQEYDNRLLTPPMLDDIADVSATDAAQGSYLVKMALGWEAMTPTPSPTETTTPTATETPAPTETPTAVPTHAWTLDDVTDNGAETDNDMSVGGNFSIGGWLFNDGLNNLIMLPKATPMETLLGAEYAVHGRNIPGDPEVGFQIGTNGECRVYADAGEGAPDLNLLSGYGAAIVLNNNTHYGAEITTTDSSGSVAIDWRLSNKQRITLNSAPCTLSFTDPGGTCNLVLVLVQGEGGSRTVTWPLTIMWPAATAPTLSTGEGSVDIVSLYYDGTSYHGMAGLDFR